MLRKIKIKIKIKAKKKKAMSISIVLLVLATLVLSSFALFTFYTREKKIQEEIHITRFLENIYSREEQINFYINEAMENAAAKSQDENEFIDTFRQELNKYKDGGFIIPELGQIEAQIDDAVEVGEENATAEFQITLEEKGEIFSASYTYTEKFEKAL